MNRLIIVIAVSIMLIPNVSEGKAKTRGGVGSFQCSGVQQALQIQLKDFNHRFKGDERHLEDLLRHAMRDGLIDQRCSSCIKTQFEHGVPISQQEACGPVTAPTDPCEDIKPTDKQISRAVDLAFPTVNDPWGNIDDFMTLMTSTEQMLGCQLSDQAKTTASMLLDKFPTVDDIFSQQAQTSAFPGINFCGPNNSAIDSRLDIVNVPQCLNDACYRHDNCYGTNCIYNLCYWTPQSSNCDHDLAATCRGERNCNISEIYSSQMARFVCAAVGYKMLTADINKDPSCYFGSGCSTCKGQPIIWGIQPYMLYPPLCPGDFYRGEFVIAGTNFQGGQVFTDGPLVVIGNASINATGGFASIGYQIGCCAPRDYWGGSEFYMYVSTPCGLAWYPVLIAWPDWDLVYQYCPFSLP